MKFNLISSQLLKINKHLIPSNISSASIEEVYNIRFILYISFLEYITIERKQSRIFAKI